MTPTLSMRGDAVIEAEREPAVKLPADGNPYFLEISQDLGDRLRHTYIDLDERGWATKHIELMRQPGRWTLISKEGLRRVLVLRVSEGEQPYYTARHVGIASGVAPGVKPEVTAYGIGKKRLDGHVDRLWLLPNGLVCTGDDVEPLALGLIKGGF
jgi:hypothetical protein